MKIVFVLPHVGISGGINVIVQHAQFLVKHGHKVSLAALSHGEDVYKSFLIEDEPLFEQISWEKAEGEQWDFAFASWWSTVFELPRLNAEKKVLLLQAWESQFYELGSLAQQSFNAALKMPGLNFLVIANWLGKSLIDNIGISPHRVKVVLNGLSNNFLQGKRDEYQYGTKVLLEGNLLDARKNTLETAQLCAEMGVPFSLVTSSRHKLPKNIKPERIFYAVPYQDMPRIYRDHDILFKLSNSEGMFGPPLEMFANHGTAVVWDCQGHEEYMVDGLNSLITPMNDFNAAGEALKSLIQNPELLKNLRDGALKTAENWRSWEDASSEFMETITKFPSSDAKLTSEFVLARDLALGAGVIHIPIETSKYLAHSSNKEILISRVKSMVLSSSLLLRIVRPAYLLLKKIGATRWI